VTCYSNQFLANLAQAVGEALGHLVRAESVLRTETLKPQRAPKKAVRSGTATGSYWRGGVGQTKSGVRRTLGKAKAKAKAKATAKAKAQDRLQAKAWVVGSLASAALHRAACLGKT